MTQNDNKVVVKFTCRRIERIIGAKQIVQGLSGLKSEKDPSFVGFDEDNVHICYAGYDFTVKFSSGSQFLEVIGFSGKSRIDGA